MKLHSLLGVRFVLSLGFVVIRFILLHQHLVLKACAPVLPIIHEQCLMPEQRREDIFPQPHVKF